MGNPAGAASLGNAYGKIIIDTSGVRTAVNEARQSLNGLQSLGGGIQSLGSSLTGFGTQMSLALAPVTGFVTQGIFAFSRFQDVMTEISARTGLVGDDLEAIRQAALQMGADTSFSATQAAEAFLQLTSSGQTAQEALATLPSVLALAAAGGIDLGYAADAVTDILSQFKLEVSDSAAVADALAAAAGSSSATVNDLVQAFANAGPIANLFGLSVDETAAALAVFAENGIKGAEAGTQLKSMLTNMMRPTEDVQGMWEELGVSMVDATGSMRPLNDVIQDLNVAMADMTESERINVINTLAGSYGQVGLAALLASDGIEDMQTQMDSQASATSVAAARMNTFSGRIESLKGSIETLSINFLGPLVEQYLTPLAENVIELVNSINDWVVENEDLAATIALVVSGLAIAGPIIAGLGMYLSTFGTLISLVGGALALLVSPIGLAIAAVVAIGAALMYLTDTSLSDLINMLGQAVQWISAFTSGLVNAFQSGGLEGAGQFIQDNLITPLLNTIATTDWNAILADMWARFKVALEGAAAIAWDALTWINTNILQPLKTEIANTNWNQVATDVGNMIVTAITTMLPIMWDALTWVWSNIVVPLIQAVLTADWASVGNALWEAFKLQLTLLNTVWEGVSQWVADHVLTPIWNEVKNADWGQIAKDVAQGLWDGLVTQASDIIDMHKWILDEVINPVLAELGIASPSTVFYEVGTNIVQGLADGLRAMVGVVATAAQAVLAAASGPLNSLISLAAQAVNAAAGSGVVGDAVSSAIGNPIVPAIVGGTGSTADVFGPGGGLALPTQNPRPQAKGGPVLRGESLLVGENGPEPFTPNANGGIMPNDVWQALQSIATSLSGPSLASAVARAGGGNGGGDVYQIAVSVPADLLRDEPNLQRNADTFADNMRLALQKRSLTA